MPVASLIDHDLTGMPPIGAGMARVANARHLPALLAGHGVRIEPLLCMAGLAEDSFARAENTIPVERAAHLFALCAEQTGHAHFGLLAGQGAMPTQLGLVGLRLLHAPTVGAAWRGLTLTLHLNGRAMVPSLLVRDEVAMLSFSFYGEPVKGYEHLLDFTLAAACNAMRALCGAAWSPSEVQISHHPPDDTRPYGRYFKAPLRFGTSRTALLFPSSLLAQRVQGADPATRRRLDKEVGDMLLAADIDLATKVRRALFVLIGQNEVSIDGVASLLAMHKRTLNRRLAEDGFTFVQLLRDVRFQIARQLLAQTDLSLVDVAASLNYADASTFSRAFSSWAKMSPSSWRSAHP